MTTARTETEGTSESQTLSYSESEAVTDAESASVAESEAFSAMDATSHSQLSGAGETMMTADMLTPAQGVFASPVLVGMSQGAGSSTHHAAGTGSSSAQGRTAGSTRGTASMHAVTHASAWGESVSRGTSRATSAGRAETRGVGKSRGSSEALEPILADRPSSVHSMQNVLYMAAQTLRNLPTGQAFINYVGRSGMVPVLLTVPRISEYPLSAAAFAALRERILSRSSAAMPIAEAARLVADREQALLAARKSSEDEPEPQTFRTRAPSEPTSDRGRSRPAAASPGPTRKASNDNRSVR